MEEEIRKQYEIETGKKWFTVPFTRGEQAFASWGYQLWLEKKISQVEPEVNMKNEIEQQIFEKMKAKDFGESMCNETKLNVLKWTMQQLRKHDVSGSLGFDKGYEQGYNDATREACKEIAKNYQPNECGLTRKR